MRIQLTCNYVTCISRCAWRKHPTSTHVSQIWDRIFDPFFKTAPAPWHIHWLSKQAFYFSISSQHICRLLVHTSWPVIVQRWMTPLRCEATVIYITLTPLSVYIQPVRVHHLTSAWKHVCTNVSVLWWAITEGVGLATVTNTSQPLKTQRARHRQRLFKKLVRGKKGCFGGGMNSETVLNFENLKENNRSETQNPAKRANYCVCVCVAFFFPLQDFFKVSLGKSLEDFVRLVT